MEIWKDIPGYEGWYQVSSLGSVRSVKRTIVRNIDHKVKTFQSRVLCGSKAPNGYMMVALSKQRKYRKFLVHRLVAMAFIGIPGGMLVDHIDCDRSNNVLSNLRICTPSQNSWHRSAKKNTGIRPTRNGKWQPFLCVNYKTMVGETQDTPELAMKIRLDMEKKFHGEYSARRMA